MKNLRMVMVTLVAIFSFNSRVYAQSKWIDITSEYVQNPSFDNNSRDGWSANWVGSSNTNFGCHEFWYAQYDMWQWILNLPTGKYRLSLQGYYRETKFTNSSAQNPNDDQVKGFFYVYNGEERVAEQKLKNYYSEWMTMQNTYSSGTQYAQISRTEYRFYPNNMECANYCFNTLGMYKNEMEFDWVASPNGMCIGIYCPQRYSENWTIFDNFKLEYYGTEKYITSIVLNESNLKLCKSESYNLVYTLTPSFVTSTNIVWSSSNPSVATVDENGVVTGAANGSAIITCRDVVSGKSAKCNVVVSYDVPTVGVITINEIQARNIDQYLDLSTNYGGWIELYNSSNKPMFMEGCYVKDSRGNEWQIPTGWGSIPANGYRLLYFDHSYDYGSKNAFKQCPFKLDTDGGLIMITDESGTTLCEAEFPVMYGRSSWARVQNLAEEWGYCAEPTPGASNNGAPFVEEQLEMPVVDAVSQIYSSPFTFTVEIPDGQTLLYTIDGATPTFENAEVSSNGIFYVDGSSSIVYRFRLFQNGYMPSEVVTRSFILRERDYDLPSVNVVTEPGNLFDDYYGCWVRGYNGRSGNGVTGTAKANWNMDWERPVNFEHFNVDGLCDFSQEADFAISGGWSRYWGQVNGSPHSFKIKSGKKYGINELSYQWFDEKPYNKYKHILLRNGGNDSYNRSRTKDNILQQILLTSGLYIDCQERQPVHVFVNGAFRGTMNMREVTNKQFGYSNYGLDTDAQDAFEISVDSGYVQTSGDRVAFEEWKECAKSADDPIMWNRIEELVDIDEFVNYFASQFYLVNWDWPHNNLKAFRGRFDEEKGQRDGKFHFVIFDLDNCYDQTFNPFQKYQNESTYTFYPIFREDGSSYNLTLEVEIVQMFLNMLKNEDFKKRFIDSYCLILGSVFEPERCAEIIDAVTNQMYKYISWEGNSYYVNQVSSNLKSKLTANQQKTQLQNLKSYMGLYDDESLTAKLSTNIPDGKIEVNGIEVPTNKFDGKLYYPITVTAKAPAGYKFARWMSNLPGNQTGYLFNMKSTWNYYDQGSLDGKSWQVATDQDTEWQEGTGSFGFNPRAGAKVTTTLDYGDYANNKRPTYYFRKNVTLISAPESTDKFTMSINYDDGYIVYVNGTEVAKKRLNSGASYSDYAWEYGSDPYDTDNIEISSSVFKKGNNIIAVELHNQSATSSDVYFDASLYLKTSEYDVVFAYEPVIELEAGEEYSLVAEWEKMTDQEKLQEGISIAPVVINEVSAGNNVYLNEYFKKDDWIELYNTTDTDIDLEGMYLTDNSAKPQKYQITAQVTDASTIIKAHGYKVIWCSKRDTDKQLHANFKLNNEDGALVRLSAADESWADSLVYCFMNGDESYGRYPDGGVQTYHMSLPTIDKSNKLTIYSKEWTYKPEETDIQDVLAVRSNGISVGLSGDILYINGDESANAHVCFYNINGQQVLSRNVDMTDGQATVNVGSLATGIYVVRVTANDETIGIKFRK